MLDAAAGNPETLRPLLTLCSTATSLPNRHRREALERRLMLMRRRVDSMWIQAPGAMQRSLARVPSRRRWTLGVTGA